MELTSPDESGRRKPVPVPGSAFTIDCDTVITALGELPDFSFLDGFEEKLNQTRDSLKTQNFGQTNYSKIFAGGDIIDEPRTVVNAIGSGRYAALSIDAYLSNKKYSFCSNEKITLFSDINLDYFNIEKKINPKKLDLNERKKTFSEVNYKLSEDELKYELSRCFSCGVCNACDNCFIYCPDVAIARTPEQLDYKVDYDHCKGCMICKQECPRDAIGVKE
jgi:NADPH-dependent glutamate synthase beta subunit-like oxidoreductase